MHPLPSQLVAGRCRTALAVVVVALLSSGCARGVSNCARSSSDTWNQTGSSFGSLDVLSTLTDVVMAPVTATSECATAMALSPIQTLIAQQRERKIKAVHVSAEEAEASAKRVRTGRSSPTAPGTTPEVSAALKEEDPCQYRSMCVVASTLVVSPSRVADASGGAATGHAQYELTNDCGEPIECYICGTKNGTIARDADPCDDSNHYGLDIGETWITKGTTHDIDGMAMTCLLKSKSEDSSCRTWPK